MRYVVVLFFAVLTTLPRCLFAQESKTVKGTILNGQNNLPLADVNVVIKGTGNGTRTGSNGEYSIAAKSSDVIVFSFLGYVPHEVQVGDQTTIDFTLEISNSNLDEVVVIGYGTAKRRDLTGAVSSVTAKDIAVTPVANVAQAIQGKLAGVSVTSQDGRPGADVSILVRGARSISQSNQPLILIDGVPGTLSDIPVDQVKSIDVLKDASSSAIYGARGANGVILVTTKGAQAGKVSISYNGYVKFNEPTKYLAALGPYDYLKYVWANAAANGTAYQTPFEKLYGLGANTGTNTGGIESYKDLASDDMQKMVYNSSTSWSHDLTITGGTDKTKVLFALNYIDEEGMKINSFAKRGNAAFKITQKLFDNVSFGIDVRYTDIKSMGDESTTNGYGSILSTAFNFRPIATPHILGDLTALKQGNIDLYGKNVMWDSYSPAARTGDYFPLTLNQKLRGIGSLDWRIIKNLTYHTDLTASRSWVQQKYWSGAVYNAYIDEATGANLFAGNADYRKSDSWYSRWSNTLNYQYDINANNKLNLLAGQEVSNSGGTGMAIQANHFPANFDQKTAFAQINQYNQTVGSASFSSSVAIPDRLLSFFGRANYSLLDRYLFTATFRADGSSKFAPEHRWGYFPAGAVAWKASQEQFLRDISWLDNLKVRASFGEVGNDGINSNLWSQTWGSVTDQRLQYAINGQRQSAYDLASATLANPDLKWETTLTRDIGIDFGLFKNRLWGTIDVYKNTTKDLLMLTSIPGITGFTATYANIGQTSNKGIEISLSGAILQNKDWTVNAGANINFNKSNVDKLAPNVTGLYGTNWGGVFTYPTNDYILQVGKPVGLVRGLTYDGFYTPADFTFSNGKYTLDPSKHVPDLGSWFTVVHGLTANDLPSTQHAYPGLPKYKDLNGDGKIDDNDLSVIGNMNPKFTGGANFSASYKGIDLALYFNFSYGNQIYNANKLATLYGPKEQGVYQNKLAIMANSYKIYDVVNGQLVRLTTPDQLNNANANANLPLSYQEVQGISTLGIEDGSFLRLNTLSLGYTLPKSITSKAKISSVRVYGSIYNVFTITGYSGLDPEVNVDPSHNGAVYPTIGFDFGAYPRARSFVVGLNLNL
jgi:TonB-linked SusC/RagA family outer membrane protein